MTPLAAAAAPQGGARPEAEYISWYFSRVDGPCNSAPGRLPGCCYFRGCVSRPCPNCIDCHRQVCYDHSRRCDWCNQCVCIQCLDGHHCWAYYADCSNTAHNRCFVNIKHIVDECVSHYTILKFMPQSFGLGLDKVLVALHFSPLRWETLRF